jgi:uncharacterized protein
MSKDYTTLPANEVRRADRAVNDETWISAFLEQAAIGYLATVYDGQPFINSNLFFYDSAAHVIYLHTARTGRTRTNLDLHEEVCFSTSSMGRLLPAKQALEFSVEYSGVVVFGKGQVVTDSAEASEALQKLLDKYFPHLTPGQDYEGVTAEELARTAVYRVRIDNWSGKRKQVADDFAGAFHYPINKAEA